MKISGTILKGVGMDARQGKALRVRVTVFYYGK